MPVSSTSSVGVKVKMEKIPSRSTVIRFPVRSNNNEGPDKSPRRNGYGNRDDRHNVNNFLVVHIKGRNCENDRVDC